MRNMTQLRMRNQKIMKTMMKRWKTSTRICCSRILLEKKTLGIDDSKQIDSKTEDEKADIWSFEEPTEAELEEDPDYISDEYQSGFSMGFVGFSSQIEGSAFFDGKLDRGIEHEIRELEVKDNKKEESEENDAMMEREDRLKYDDVGISAVDVYNNFVYFAQYDTITKLPLPALDRKNLDHQTETGLSSRTLFKPADFVDITSIKVLNEESIIIASDVGLATYDTKTGAVDVKRTGCCNHVSVQNGRQTGWQHAQTSTRKHKVYTLNGEQELIAEIGGGEGNDKASDEEDMDIDSPCKTLPESASGKGSAEDGYLDEPHATVITDSGAVLVADWNNHRISQFSMKGEFQGHVLTEKNGLQYPVALAYRKPHLWLLERYVWLQEKRNRLKCFVVDIK